ncbi:MAG: hypothetical protein M1817_001696 [Caeruleum heppii]|nr:MAG: hypothetical protein M1817_001696 [Caeruleum heppii]
MAKVKPHKKVKKRLRRTSSGVPASEKSSAMSEDKPDVLLSRAVDLLHISQSDEALPLAQKALEVLQRAPGSPEATLPALKVIGEIQVERGDIEAAAQSFLRAVDLDPEGDVPEDAGGGPEKFLWLAQLCEAGGLESVHWFERGSNVLRKQIQILEGLRDQVDDHTLEEKRRKLSNALCGVVEIYMTDLSWEEDAENRCESLVTEALLVAPTSPEALQTLASVRISQMKMDDARAALSRSMDLWKELPPEDVGVPDFPTRVSLARLLLETEMEEDALEVLERLITEDDQSVEVWYLGGWCLYLLGMKHSAQVSKSDRSDRDRRRLWGASREWLEAGLKLYELLQYEDQRLHEHAVELVSNLNRELGERNVDVEDDSSGESSEESFVDDFDDEHDGNDEEGDAAMTG